MLETEPLTDQVASDLCNRTFPSLQLIQDGFVKGQGHQAEEKLPHIFSCKNETKITHHQGKVDLQVH